MSLSKQRDEEDDRENEMENQRNLVDDGLYSLMTHANRPKINPIYLGLWPKIINWALERWHNNSFLTKKHRDSTFGLIFPPFPLLQTNFRIASVKTIPLRLFSFLYIIDSSQFYKEPDSFCGVRVVITREESREKRNQTWPPSPSLSLLPDSTP